MEGSRAGGRTTLHADARIGRIVTVCAHFVTPPDLGSNAMRKELKQLVREARRQGWKVAPTKSGYQLLSPDGAGIVTIHKTPSPRAIRHYVADMRKFGFEWKGR